MLSSQRTDWEVIRSFVSREPKTAAQIQVETGKGISRVKYGLKYALEHLIVEKDYKNRTYRLRESHVTREETIVLP